MLVRFSTLVLLLLTSVLGYSLNFSVGCFLELSDKNSTVRISEHCKDVTIHLTSDFIMIDHLDVTHKDSLTILGNNHTITCNLSSGISTANVTNVTVENLKLCHCGMENKYNNITFHSAFTVQYSAQIIITNARFEYSSGTGLVLYNSEKLVEVRNCTFTHSKIPQDFPGNTSGGGGMYIEQLCDDQFNNSHCAVNMTIENCTFSNNFAVTYDSSFGCQSGQFSGVGYGGGMSLRMQKCPGGTNVRISSCVFFDNSAIWGGGVELVLCHAQHNSILFDGIDFNGNVATDHGGGGLDVELAGNGTMNNTIKIMNSNFNNNKALYGGGTALAVNYAFVKFSNNSIEFSDCIWRENTAHYGSALDIIPSRVVDSWTELPVVTLFNCSFTRNSNCNVKPDLASNFLRQGYGTVMVMGFQLRFIGPNQFISNTGSSLYATGGLLVFENSSDVQFLNNTAEYGAGIALSGYSYMVAYSDTRFTFHNNVAELYGGGIYFYSIDKHAYVHKHHDFFHKIDLAANNVSFCFSGNISPSDKKYIDQEYKSEDVYPSSNTLRSLTEDCAACSSCNSEVYPFHTHEEDSLCFFITNTEEEDITDDDVIRYFIPGIRKDLDLNRSLGLLHVSLFQINGNITLSDNDEFIRSSLTLFGKTNAAAKMRLSQSTFEGLIIEYEVQLINCPPMYKLDGNECLCYQNDEWYYGYFFKCLNGENNIYSSVSNGYWVNYDRNLSEMLVGYCPVGYCNIANQSDSFSIALPFNFSNDTQEFDLVICSSNRHGVLCGECTDNNAVWFHSRLFECKHTELCHLGPLFFLIAEILPVTLVFLFLILLDIKLTSGSLNGFIFFAQMYESINIKLESFIKNDISANVTAFHHIIYQLFNFDFLEVSSLSFCLWEKATTLDILVMKYVVSVYALLLILGVIIFIKVCTSFHHFRIKFKMHSVVQVISTFLIIVYTKCTYVSFSILWYQDLYHQKSRYKTVVSLQGNLQYFHGRHIPYAITALLVLIFLTMPLPLVLLTYPLSNKVISRLRMEESTPVKAISKLLPLHKFLPLFDCFQGYYKDKYRFFAGLYFVYRVAILTALLAPQVSIIYLVVLMLIIMMILVHFVSLPYKNKGHNIIDALLFANLGIITSLKLMMVTITDFATPYAIRLVHIVEIIFVNIPIGVAVAYLLYRLYFILCKLHKNKHNNTEKKKPRHDSFLSDTIREGLDDYHPLKDM